MTVARACCQSLTQRQKCHSAFFAGAREHNQSDNPTRPAGPRTREFRRGDRSGVAAGERGGRERRTIALGRRGASSCQNGGKATNTDSSRSRRRALTRGSRERSRREKAPRNQRSPNLYARGRSREVEWRQGFAELESLLVRYESKPTGDELSRFRLTGLALARSAMRSYRVRCSFSDFRSSASITRSVPAQSSLATSAAARGRKTVGAQFAQASTRRRSDDPRRARLGTGEPALPRGEQGASGANRRQARPGRRPGVVGLWPTDRVVGRERGFNLLPEQKVLFARLKFFLRSSPVGSAHIEQIHASPGF